MKILLLCSHNPTILSNSYTTFREIFSQNVSNKLLHRYHNIIDVYEDVFDFKNKNVVQDNLSTLNKKYDFIIATGLAELRNADNSIISLLRDKLNKNGKLCQICDHELPASQKYDITFTQRIVTKNHNLNKYVGWAADDSLFTYDKVNSDSLNIVIDHAHYVNDLLKHDITNKILYFLKNFIDSGSWKDKYREVIVYRLINNGIEKINFKNMDKSILNAPIKLYNRKSVSQLELAKLLSTSHIFIPTHKESLGITALEAAMAGNLILSKHGHIAIDRLNTINNVLIDFDHDIDWVRIMSIISPEINSTKASKNNFDAMTKNIMYELSNL